MPRRDASIRPAVSSIRSRVPGSDCARMIAARPGESSDGSTRRSTSPWPAPFYAPPNTSSSSATLLSSPRPTSSESVFELLGRPVEPAVGAAATPARETCVQRQRSPPSTGEEASPLPLSRVPEPSPHSIPVESWPNILQAVERCDSISPANELCDDDASPRPAKRQSPRTGKRRGASTDPRQRPRTGTRQEARTDQREPLAAELPAP